jgi:hypothetical protein
MEAGWTILAGSASARPVTETREDLHTAEAALASLRSPRRVSSKRRSRSPVHGVREDIRADL